MEKTLELNFFFQYLVFLTYDIIHHIYNRFSYVFIVHIQTLREPVDFLWFIEKHSRDHRLNDASDLSDGFRAEKVAAGSGEAPVGTQIRQRRDDPSSV